MLGRPPCEGHTCPVETEWPSSELRQQTWAFRAALPYLDGEVHCHSCVCDLGSVADPLGMDSWL